MPKDELQTPEQGDSSITDTRFKSTQATACPHSDLKPPSMRVQSTGGFELMAQLYGDYPNGIYEVWNEPLDTHSWGDDIRPCAEFVIEGICNYDPDNLILVGSSSNRFTGMFAGFAQSPSK